MECAPINSFIITISFQLHGTVTNINLTPKEDTIFKNVRYFSQPGDFDISQTNQFFDNITLNYLKEIFQKSLKNTYDVMDTFAKNIRPKYNQLLKSFDNNVTKTKDKTCTLHNTVVFDKIFSKEYNRNNSSNKIISYIKNCISIPDNVSGIYLISIHKKIDHDKYELFPENFLSEYNNLNLTNIQDFIKFSKLFHREDYLTENLITDKPNIDIDDDEIKTIKMSFLIQLIKQICGLESYINILDFSCSRISEKATDKDRINEKYFKITSTDIENPLEPNFGGKRTNKNRKIKTKNKKQKKTKKTKEQKNKKTRKIKNKK